MRITKVYTGVGDGGQTYLADGKKVSKTHPRVEAYGCVDELNSFIGLVRSKLPPHLSEVDGVLKQVQNDLFLIGGDLATPEGAPFEVKRLGDEKVKYLEETIDGFNSDLRPLEEFILPTGSEVAALLHVSRTVCRRAERVLVRAMSSDETLNPRVQVYLNRLSDLLFVLARWVNWRMGVPEEKAEFR